MIADAADLFAAFKHDAFAEPSADSQSLVLLVWKCDLMLSTQARTLNFHKFYPQPTKNRQFCCQGSLRVSLDVFDSFRLHQHRQLKPMPISQTFWFWF